MKRLRRALAAIAVATAAVVATTTGADAASAAPARPAAAQDSIQTFQNRVWGNCMDDSTAGLRAYGCNYGVYQQWRVHVWNDGTRRLQNVATGRCIEDTGTALFPGGCDTSTRQSWYVEQSGGQVKFVNQQYRNCITEYGSNLRVASCTSPLNTDSPWWY